MTHLAWKATILTQWKQKTVVDVLYVVHDAFPASTLKLHLDHGLHRNISIACCTFYRKHVLRGRVIGILPDNLKKDVGFPWHLRVVIGILISGFSPESK